MLLPTVQEGVIQINVVVVDVEILIAATEAKIVKLTLILSTKELLQRKSISE